MNWQAILVAIVILAAAAYLGRVLYRTWSGKSAGCHCGNESCGISQRTAREANAPEHKHG